MYLRGSNLKLTFSLVMSQVENDAVVALTLKIVGEWKHCVVRFTQYLFSCFLFYGLVVLDITLSCFLVWVQRYDKVFLQ
jgi:hypothetical protein